MVERFESPQLKDGIPLNEKIFEKLEGISPEIKDGDKKKKFEESIIASKKESFHFAENILGKMLGEDSFKEEAAAESLKKEHGEFSEKDPSHDIINKFYALSAGIELAGIPKKEWPKNTSEAQKIIKKIALTYALETALNFQNLVYEKHLPAEEAIKKLRLSEVVEKDYLEERIIKRIEALPPVLKEHLFQ